MVVVVVVVALVAFAMAATVAVVVVVVVVVAVPSCGGGVAIVASMRRTVTSTWTRRREPDRWRVTVWMCFWTATRNLRGEKSGLPAAEANTWGDDIRIRVAIAIRVVRGVALPAVVGLARWGGAALLLVRGACGGWHGCVHLQLRVLRGTLKLLPGSGFSDPTRLAVEIRREPMCLACVYSVFCRGVV